MPCSTPEESNNEKESRRVSKLILIFDKKMGIESDQNIKDWSKAYFENHCDIVTPLLCANINSLSKEERERVVYDAHDKESRMLADWFDEHDAFDKNR